MSKKLFSNRSRTVVVLLFFAAALVVVGFVLRTRIGALVTSYTEGQTGKRAESFALLVGEKFKTELDNLAYIASKLEASPDQMGDLMPRLYNQAGVKQGLLTIDGDALYGEPLDFWKFIGIHSSFRGEKVITFVGDEGLLFTCPVFHGANIRYVLYRLFPLDTLGETFSTEIYDDLGKICVATREGKIVVPFHNDEGGEDLNWFRNTETQKNFTSMHIEMEVSVAVARSFDTDRGEMILFESEIPGTDYLVSGYVPTTVAAEGIGNINLLVVWVFGLLMLLVMIGAIYLTRARIKIRESDALREAKAVAEEASRAKSDFLANMSHEIRTPINAVLGMDEMILRESDDESIISYASNIKTAGTTLLGLINDILDFSKIEAGKIELIEADYDIASVINDLVNMISVRADEKGLAMYLDFDPELPRRLHGDEVRIKQVITNILTNAVKYTEEGSVTFHIGFEKNATDPDTIYLHVSVSDTGIGIREEDMDKLFSEFERIEEERNRNIEGTGLGMNITRHLIEMMGSTLQVESQYGEGSIFYFSLKQKVVDAEPLGDYERAYRKSVKQRAAYRESFIAPEARVLMVDDNPMNIRVFRSLLKKTRVRIDTAESGDGGLKLAQEKEYDIIFLDHMMPDKDGIETLHELRAREELNRETPAICLTANAIAGAREMYLSEGFDDYLSKPVDPEELEEMMRQYLPDEKLSEPEEADEAEDGETVELPDFLSDIEEINLKKGLANNGGDVEDYLDMLRLYAGTADRSVEEIRSLYQSGDVKNATIKIHAIKSTLRLVGAIEAGELAQRLEDAGKAEDTVTLDAELEGLLTRCLEVGEALSPLRETQEEVDDSGLPPIGEEQLRTYWDFIRERADKCDDVGLEELLDDMASFRLPEEEKSRMQRIREALDEFDFEKVKQELDG